MSERLKDSNFRTMARAIVRAAMSEGREAELIDCLLDGGSATINATTGKLDLASGDQLAQFLDGLSA